MSDLIRRKDAVELLKSDMGNNGLPLYDDYNIGINHAMCLLACVPTADLVRCGECKHYEHEICRLDPFWERYTEPNDFCSQGERRE